MTKRVWIVGITSRDMDDAEVIWEFFERFSMSNLAFSPANYSFQFMITHGIWLSENLFSGTYYSRGR